MGSNQGRFRPGGVHIVAVVAVLAWFCGGGAGWAIELSGTVKAADGVPIERARVISLPETTVVYTDEDGAFNLEAELPTDLAISHPRFQEVRLAVEQVSEPLAVVLERRQGFSDQVVVTANKGEKNYAPVSIAANAIDPLETAGPSTTLTDLVTSVPGVSENGQGGIFQVYSIRGVSRQRVLTLIDGMRIVSERRAGVSASFIDPGLMQTVEVLRGPSSTYYGSGALGGVVQLFPRRFEGLSVSAGYETQGDEHFQSIGWGDGKWSLGLTHRTADRAETANGIELNSGFTQVSGALVRSWQNASRSWDLTLLASQGDDIGKDNNRFPGQETVYPDESHILTKLAVRGTSGWNAEVWTHINDLETRDFEPGAEEAQVLNEAIDLGASWQTPLVDMDHFRLRLGADYFGRRGVEADESFTNLETGETTGLQPTLDDGEEDELGLFSAAEWNQGPFNFVAGTRLSWQRQSNAGDRSEERTAWTGFAGMVVPLGAGFEGTANVGTGLRFPSLTERFFSGTTGRGRIEGNPDLVPERSLNVDLGLRWYGQKTYVAGYIFRNQIDRYIERIEFAPDELTFVNLDEGTLEGIELELTRSLSDRWTLGFGAHKIQGESASGDPLADVPPDRLSLNVGYKGDPVSSSLRWESRLEKDDPGSGEVVVPSAQVVSFEASYPLTEDLEIQVGASNLLDEEYFRSADRRAQIAVGRSFSFGFGWSR